MQTTAAPHKITPRFEIDITDEMDHAGFMQSSCRRCKDLSIHRRDPLALCPTHEESPTIHFVDPGLF